MTSNPNLRRLFLAIILGAFASIACADQFDTYHPDQQFRVRAIKHWEANSPELSYQDFMTAARYADKTSQISIALMYWTGNPVAKDRATAYAWADIASERGYPDFLRTREEMWAALTPEEQARAIEVGTQLYKVYGDAVAKQRTENLLRSGLRLKTGTRTGASYYKLGVTIVTPQARAAMLSASGPTPLAAFMSGLVLANMTGQAADYWNDANWRPKQYWTRQDRLWDPDGKVTIGPLASQDKSTSDRDDPK